MRIKFNTKSSRSKKIAVILIFLAIIVVLNLTGFSKNIKNFFFLISSPIQESFWRAGENVSNFFDGFSKTQILREKLEILELKNQELLGQIVLLRELKKENEFLRQALGIDLEEDFRIMLARAVSKDVFQDSILINKGRKDGVSEGWPVITEQRVLLGRIGQVYDNFSEVILISNKKSSFDAKVIEKEIYGIMKGKGGFELELGLIPKDEEISRGEIIITSVLGGIYPPGLLVGKIRSVKKSDVEPFQAAEVEPSFNIRKLDYLFIITEF